MPFATRARVNGSVSKLEVLMRYSLHFMPPSAP
jgi:hypothetical protein